MKPIFEPGDFLDRRRADVIKEVLAQITRLDRIFEIAVKRGERLAELEPMIAEAPVVYGSKNARGFWYFDEQPSEADTHRARLVMIEEIKKPCKP